MRLLLLGANGQVGWELRRSLMPLGEVMALDRQQCDLSQPERLPALVRDMSPAVIVNAAAYTAVDQAEGEEQLAMTVNCAAAGVLAEQARACGALLVHYSTDYVFDGTKEAPYLEEDTPHPVNAYGRSKLAGEIAIRQAGAAYLIFRTSWVYAARGRNFVRTLLQLAGERDELPVVADQVGTPNWARNIADATAYAVRQALAERVGGSFVSGLFHLTASGTTSWYGFGSAIMEYAMRNGLIAAQRLPRLRPIPTEEYPTLAARPRNSGLGGNGLSERFGIVLPDWKQGLTLCLREIAKC
jgi:dTDP-4-dehydrorhamnose reductase